MPVQALNVTPPPIPGPRLVQSVWSSQKPTAGDDTPRVRPCSDGWPALTRCAPLRGASVTAAPGPSLGGWRRAEADCSRALSGPLLGSDSGQPRRAEAVMRLGGRRVDVGRIARILLVVAASVDRFALPHRVGWRELVAAVGVRVWTARETRNRREGVEECREIPLETRRGVGSTRGGRGGAR
jgi:hypothetical protein